MEWTQSGEWLNEERNGQRVRGWRKVMDVGREGETWEEDGDRGGEWRLEAGSVEV